MKQVNALALAAAALLSACGGGNDAEPPAAATASPQAADMEAAVAAAMQQAKHDEVMAAYRQEARPVVEPHRRSADGTWVFGGGYFPIPDTVEETSPVTTLFVARKVDHGWEVALEDTERFNAMVREAPDDVVGGAERKVFAAREDTRSSRLEAAQAAAVDVGLSLPFQRNGSVWGHSGVHGDSASSRPYNAIDFWGGDGRVLASREGVAYKFCTNSRWPYIKVVHPNGWTSGYYHTREQASLSNGQHVDEGEFIGKIGVELPCGGRASGNHVHWTLWRGSQKGAAEAVEGKLIGGWTWHEGSQPYQGYAERNGVKVDSRHSGLVNYGHGGGTPPQGPCSGPNCKQYTGSLTQAGTENFHPGQQGFQWHGGTLKAWLKGPDNADFDLVLGRYDPRDDRWHRVAGSDGSSSVESLSYNAPEGLYRWRINDYRGTGSYTLWTDELPQAANPR